MRILLDYRPALRERTGVGEYVHELTQALLATATDPAETLVAFSSSWKDRLPASSAPGAAVIDRRIPGRVLNLLWHRLAWPPVERIAGGSFDIVQAFHPLLIPSRGAARLVTIHDLDFLDHPERTTREIRRDYPALARAHAARANRIITNSRTTANDVHARFGEPLERITVCYPGAPPWQPRTEEPASGCLLFLGSLEPRKNLGVLIDAYERLLAETPDAPPLVLAGKAGADATLIRARTADRPLAGRVELPGYVGVADREALFKRALLFIMPSHTEGFGMPVLEAMTAGVPVVVADRGALPEVCGDAARYFEPDDAVALQAILRSLLASLPERQRMRERGLARARQFTWRGSAAALRDAWKLAFEARRGVRG